MSFIPSLKIPGAHYDDDLVPRNTWPIDIGSNHLFATFEHAFVSDRNGDSARWFRIVSRSGSVVTRVVELAAGCAGETT